MLRNYNVVLNYQRKADLPAPYTQNITNLIIHVILIMSAASVSSLKTQ